MASLSPSQQAELCSDFQRYGSKLSADLCKSDGFNGAVEVTFTNNAATDADLQAACNTAYAACFNADAGTGTCSPLNPSTCAATVAQVSACLNDTGALDDQIVAKYPTCSSLTAANLESAVSFFLGDAGWSEPASCAALTSSCPGAVTPIMR